MINKNTFSYLYKILYENINNKNYKLNIDYIDYFIKRIIISIIFLRILNDKKIEKDINIKNLLNNSNIYLKLIELFGIAKNKYNSNLFDLDSNICIDDNILEIIINNIYDFDLNYEYDDYISILGDIYEQFNIGNKNNDIYYTPSYIVDYIVSNTVEELIKNKTPEDVNNLKILDPACGSGSFLLGAYDFLLNYHLTYYLENKDFAIKANKIYEKEVNNYVLTIEEKKNILLNNIYGVDIDSGAIEVTKLSLILKLLESETYDSIQYQLNYNNGNIIPDLSNNIKFGNSLIDTSIYINYQLSLFESNNLNHLNPMDWEKAFPEIIKNGGFDVIIGNPPYVREYTNREPFEYMKLCKAKKYYQGKMDLWYAFACKSIDLLKLGGYHSFIATSNWTTAFGASILRNKIINETKILKYIDFVDFKVFKNASIQTMIYVVKKEKPDKEYKVKYTKILNKNIMVDDLIYILNKDIDNENYINDNNYEMFIATINPSELRGGIFTFVSDKIKDILNKIEINSNFKLYKNEIYTGIFASPDECFIINDISQFNDEEKQFIKPYYTSTNRYYIQKTNNYIIYLCKNNFDRLDINSYPNIKNHFDKYKIQLKNAKIKHGEFNKPYFYIDGGINDNFYRNGPKIVCQRRSHIQLFLYTEDEYYGSSAIKFLVSNRINLKYLTALLNSTIILFWLKNKGKRLGDMIHIRKEILLQLPLIKPKDENIIQYIAKLVDDIIEISKLIESSQQLHQIEFYKDLIKSWENKINQKLYDLYGLSADDIIFIEKLI